MIHVFGDVNIDFVWQLPEPLIFGGPQLSLPLAIEVGGVGFNSARALADLSEDGRLIARVGQDALGDFIVATLARQGLRHDVIRDPQRQTGVATLMYAPGAHESTRALLINQASANHCFPVEDLPALAFAPTDLLLLTGYSIFRPGTYAACRRLAQAARAAGARLVVDLLPHDLTRAGAPQSLMEKLQGLGGPFDLCIGEEPTWAYLLGLTDEHPTRAALAEGARRLCRHCCIRHGLEHCEREALFLDGEFLYDTDTGYLRQPRDGRRAYGDLLTARLLAELFLGKQLYLYDPAHEFSIALDVFDLLPRDLPPEARILDVGCGYGRTFEALLARGFRRITGLEPSHSLVSAARRRYPQVEIVQAAFEQWSVPRRGFEVVLLVGVLTCLHSDALLHVFLQRTAQALAAGGSALIADFALTEQPDYQAKYERYHRLFPEQPFGVFVGDHGTVNRHYDPTRLRDTVAAYLTIRHWEERHFRTSFGGRARGFVLRADAPR